MPDSRLLAVIGAGLLLAGIFMPVLSVPMFGSVSYLQYNSNDALVIGLLAVGSFILAGTGRTQQVLFTGLGALAMLAYSYIRFISAMDEMRSRIEAQLGSSPFAQIAQSALGEVQVRWGWAILVLGAAMTVWAGIQAWRAGRSPRDP